MTPYADASRQLSTAIESEEKMNQLSLPVNGVEFCETPTARDILNVLTISTDAPDMGIGLIVGSAGVGKTTTIRHFAANNPFAHVVTMNGATTTMTAVLERICKSLMGYGSKRVSEMHEMIVNYFMFGDDDAESQVLIIDEAQELNDQIINELRQMYDTGYFGLVLCGNAQFRNRFNHAEASAFAQVTSRIGMRAEIPGPTENDIEAICKFRKINGIAEQKFVIRQGRSSGALRTVTKLINIASGFPEPGETVTIDHLKAAAGMLGLRGGK